MKRIGLVAALALVAGLVVAIPLVARGGTGGSTLDYTERVAHSGPIDTNSTQWQLITEIPAVNVAAGSLSVRFSGAGFAQDYGAGGVFKGEKYAALKVKVMFGEGNAGAVTFADNRGVVASSTPKPMINTGEWGTGSPTTYDVAVYMKSLNPNDLVGFKYWNLTLNYGKAV